MGLGPKVGVRVMVGVGEGVIVGVGVMVGVRLGSGVGGSPITVKVPVCIKSKYKYI